MIASTTFTFDPLASWFGVDIPFGLDELIGYGFEIDDIYDDDTGEWIAPRPHERLFFVFRGVAMGWTWALFFANEAVTHQVSLFAGAVPGDAMRERNPTPVIALGRPVVGTYVDNIQVVGSSAADVDARLGGVEKRMLDLGIPFDLTHTTAQLVLQTIGLEYDFANRRPRKVPSRVWRFVYATRALLRRSRMTGKTMEVWLGHAVSLLQLTRPPHCPASPRSTGSALQLVMGTSPCGPRSCSRCGWRCPSCCSQR